MAKRKRKTTAKRASARRKSRAEERIDVIETLESTFGEIENKSSLAEAIKIVFFFTNFFQAPS